VAATVVTLLQFLRLRDRRLLLLATMFACQAQALAREWWDVWRDVYQSGVCAAGLLLLLALSPRQQGQSTRPKPVASAAPPQTAEPEA
jgi:hypothetical protein